MIRYKLDIPVPESFEQFESLCLEIFNSEFNYNLKKFGGSGQAQYGIDLIDTAQQIGVQCKLRSPNKGGKLKLQEFKKDIEKATTLPLEKLHYVISTQSIAQFQKHVLHVSDKYPFKIEVWGWDSFKEILRKNTSILSRYMSEIKPENSGLAALTELIKLQENQTFNSNLLPTKSIRSPNFKFIVPELYIEPKLSLLKGFNPDTDASSLEFVSDSFRCTFVISEPGGGKSTFLKKAYWSYCDKFKGGDKSLAPLFFDAKRVLGAKKFNPIQDLSLDIDSLLNDNKCQFIVFLDAIDEALEESSHLFDLLKYFKSPRFNLVLASRKRFYVDIIEKNEELGVLINEVAEIKPWEVESQSIPFMSSVISQVDVSLTPKLQSLNQEKLVDDKLLVKPLNCLLICLILLNKTNLNIRLNSSFSLYDAFFKIFISSESTRAYRPLKPSNLERFYTLLALELFESKASRMIDLLRFLKTNFDCNDLHIREEYTSLLSILPSNDVGRVVVEGFFHETIMEYLIGKSLRESFLLSIEKTQKTLSLNLTYDVNVFFRESLKELNQSQLVTVQKHLKTAYQNSLLSQDYSTDTEKIRGQILYIWGRVPNTDNAFLKLAYENDSSIKVRLSAAISSAHNGYEEIELDYMNRMEPKSEFDIATRSLLLVYFGDVNGDTYSYVDDEKVAWERTRKEIFIRLSLSSAREKALRLWDLTVLRNFFESRPRSADLSSWERKVLMECSTMCSTYSDEKTLKILNLYKWFCKEFNIV